MKTTLRTRFLYTFTSLTIASIATVTGVSYWIASRAVETQVDANMESVVDQSVDDTATWFGEREREARLFAEIAEFKAACRGQNKADAAARLVAYHRQSPAQENLFVADANGVILVDAIGKSVGVDISKLPEYRANVEKARTGDVWVGTPAKSPATGRPVSLITAPIVDHGTVIGIAGMPVDLSSFSNTHIKAVKLGNAGFVAVVDDKGVTLAHPDDSLVLKFNIGTTDWGKQVLANERGRIDYTMSGIPRLARFATVKGKNWHVFAILTKTEITGAVAGLRTAALVVGAMAIAAVVAAVWFLTGNLVRKVQQVADSLGGGSEQVSSAATQVTAASQALAAGATEQAASIEETTASLEELSGMTKSNSENAGRATALAREARQAADGGADQVKAMSAAMDNLKASSGDIAKIIKTIDEIAFQTNILALNAAVEAARAGEAGLGFAVVADEVRNLARRAAEAAKETAAKIEGTIANTQQGVDISHKVGTTLAEIVEKVRKVDDLVADVSTASQEQSQGIQQISSAVAQMDQVVQRNASGAEESASAAEELNAQAQSLREVVGELLSLVNGAAVAERPTQPALPPAKTRRAASSDDRISLSGNGGQPSPRTARSRAKDTAATFRGHDATDWFSNDDSRRTPLQTAPSRFEPGQPRSDA